MNRQSKNLEGERSLTEAAERFRRLVEGWMADDSGYDEEACPELKEALDRDRLGYRKLFPE